MTLAFSREKKKKKGTHRPEKSMAPKFSMLQFHSQESKFWKMPSGSAAAMIPAEEALQIVLRVAQRLPPVSVPLHEALGKVLAEDITAPDPLPPYPASIKVFLKPYFLSLTYTTICISLLGCPADLRAFGPN